MPTIRSQANPVQTALLSNADGGRHAWILDLEITDDLPTVKERIAVELHNNGAGVMLMFAIGVSDTGTVDDTRSFLTKCEEELVSINRCLAA